MIKKYLVENEGREDFYNNLKIADKIEYDCNSDGLYKGTIFEFKLNIQNIYTVLQQSIKYLSRMRIKGNSIPKNILNVSLNECKAYLYNSNDFIKEIEKVYIGASSKDNESFFTKIKPEIIEYDNPKGYQRLMEIVYDEVYTKINIDLFCVCGWAERFYKEKLNASKKLMFEELRNPNLFNKYINAWKGKEEDFQHIMDILNDKINKKELGAFYTPPLYAKKATELVRKAISQVPKGNDYIILDRASGTGTLLEFLTDEELSHCVVNTYELFEWITLNKLYGDKVRLIIPHPSEVNGEHSLVKGGDALSEYFVKGQKSGYNFSDEYYSLIDNLNSYVADEKCNVIVFENPPYRNDTAKYKDTKEKKEKFNNYVLYSNFIQIIAYVYYNHNTYN